MNYNHSNKYMWLYAFECLRMTECGLSSLIYLKNYRNALWNIYIYKCNIQNNLSVLQHNNLIK